MQYFSKSTGFVFFYIWIPTCAPLQVQNLQNFSSYNFALFCQMSVTFQDFKNVYWFFPKSLCCNFSPRFSRMISPELRQFLDKCRKSMYPAKIVLENLPHWSLAHLPIFTQNRNFGLPVPLGSWGVHVQSIRCGACHVIDDDGDRRAAVVHRRERLVPLLPLLGSK